EEVRAGGRRVAGGGEIEGDLRAARLGQRDVEHEEDVAIVALDHRGVRDGHLDGALLGDRGRVAPAGGIEREDATDEAPGAAGAAGAAGRVVVGEEAGGPDGEAKSRVVDAASLADGPGPADAAVAAPDVAAVDGHGADDAAEAAGPTFA